MHYCVNGKIPLFLSHRLVFDHCVIPRSKLVGHKVNFPEFDFLELPGPLEPYVVSQWGHILRFRASQPPWVRYPSDVSATS
jgi:hypothetical protein